MINEKNMFTYTIRKMGIQKENNIVPNDPSNIFEFTSKKRKMINFDDLLGAVKRSSKNFLGEEKENKIIKNAKIVKKDSKKEKKNVKIVKKDSKKEKKNVKKDNINANKEKKNVKKEEKNVKKEEKNVETVKKNNLIKKESNFVNFNDSKKIGNKKEVFENISDILLLFCRDNNDDYCKKLYDLAIKDPLLFKDDPCEVEIRDIENKIRELDEDQNKWSRMKNTVLDENILNIPNNIIKKECKEVIEEEEDDKLSKVVFLKDNMKSYVRNISERLSEIEQKIFNMTAHDNDMDPLILLKALTRYN